MAIYAVGDLQGCLDPLLNLLEQVKFDPGQDKLWLVGDIVNRGPQSLETLRFVKSLGSVATMVLGNHDLHLLAYANGYRQPGELDTLHNILLAKDCDELIHWLHQQPLAHYDAERDVLLVHAGVPPIWSVKKTLKYAAEVEAVIRDDIASIKYLKKMYGDQPDTWDKELTGMKRLRLITNYLTRMRFCSATGTLELSCKNGPDNPPPGFAPWFHFPNPKLKKTRVIFGHWAALMGNTKNSQFIGLDTGYVWGGSLRMLRLDDHKFFEVKAQINHR